MTKLCHESMVSYLKQKGKRRRKVLLEVFDVDISKLPACEYPHQCSDVCQEQCKCGGDTCNFVFFSLECSALVETETKDRTVAQDKMKLLNSKLDYLKRALYQQFLQSARKRNAPMCGSRKYPYPHHGGNWKFRRGGVVKDPGNSRGKGSCMIDLVSRGLLIQFAFECQSYLLSRTFT